jgi:hypothetical protein
MAGGKNSLKGKKRDAGRNSSQCGFGLFTAED